MYRNGSSSLHSVHHVYRLKSFHPKLLVSEHLNYFHNVVCAKHIFPIFRHFRGLAVVSKNRKERILAIADLLAANQFDVVCLQEVWTNRDYNILREKLANVLPYSHYFYRWVNITQYRQCLDLNCIKKSVECFPVLDHSWWHHQFLISSVV